MSSAEVVDHSAAVAAGHAALREGRWAAAKAEFERALTGRQSADALAGLADALWWLCDAKPSVRYRERAFVLLSKSGHVAAAGRQAIDLAISYLVNLGNDAAAHGWLARAERVTGTLTPNPLQGWLWLLQAFLSGPQDSRHLLHNALEFARTTGDSDLELVALADLGLALVVADEVDDGLTLLDEAMAATLAGEYGRLDTVVYASCDMLAGCSLAGDLDRAAQWCRVADDFMRQYGSPFLYARCRVYYGSVLVEKGQWDRADAELRAALGMAEDAGPGARAEAAARLAELRVRQGRLDEAAALLAQFDEAARVPIPAAAVCLAQGEAGAAAAMLERHRAQLGDRHVELAPTLALLVHAYLATGDHEAAEQTALQLARVAAQNGRPLALALAALADAGVLAALGRLADATERTDVALRGFAQLDLPLDAARARLDLARLAASTNPEIAITEGRRALSAFEQLGARRDADHAAAFLRDLGVAGRVGPKNVGVLTQREQDVLRLVGRGLTNPEIAARLFISRKTAAHHVSSILAKLGLRNRAEAVAYALRELGS
jgi:DNA-binding CsgD family transcriptional regulator